MVLLILFHQQATSPLRDAAYLSVKRKQASLNLMKFHVKHSNVILAQSKWSVLVPSVMVVDIAVKGMTYCHFPVAGIY